MDLIMPRMNECESFLFYRAFQSGQSVCIAGFFGIYYSIGAIPAGLYLFLMPAYQLQKGKTPQDCLILFNRASQYLAVMLLVAIFSIWITN